MTEGGIEVTERVIQKTVQPIGATNAGYIDDHGERRSLSPVVWLTGSSANPGTDVVHLVHRVRDFIRYKNRTLPTSEIVKEFADGKPEAYGLLINNMFDLGLLVCPQSDRKSANWTLRDDDPKLAEAIRKIRRLYDDPERNGKLDPGVRRLYEEYRNMHPFSIGFRLAWEHEYPMLAKEKSRKKWLLILWNAILFLLSVIGAITGIWSIFGK